MPTGYNQIAPGRDLPNPTQPGQPGRPALPQAQQQPLQQAIIGPPQYQPDAGFTQWRQQAPNSSTPIGGNPTTGTGSVAAPPAPAGLNWVSTALKAADSTDDPNYWYEHVAADPKAMSGDQSAQNYWVDRINRGNGAAAVRSGKVQPYGDNSHGTSAHMLMWHQPQQVSNPFLQNAILGGGAPQQQPNNSLLSAVMGGAPQY